MKIKHKNPSINFLENCCERVLREKFGSTHVWCPDSWNCYPEDIGNQVVDVVLFGSFFERFFEFSHWPLENIRLWVLCERSKKVMVEVLGLPFDSIGVIQREWILEQAANPVVPDYQSSFDLVYSGRISESKNIELLLHATSLLQTKHKRNCTLTLAGEFDKETHLCSGEFQSINFRERVEDLIKTLTWKNLPQVVHGLNSSQWMERPYENPVLINLSTQIYEDFGVSLAQAQNSGWPSILSDWGGHADAQVENSMFINASLIGKSYHSRQELEIMAGIVASMIDAKMSVVQRPKLPKIKTQAHMPKISPIASLRQTVVRFIAKKPSSLLWAFRKNLATFAMSDSGRSFFLNYRRIFSGAETGTFDLLLFDSYHELSTYLANRALGPDDYLINIDKLSLKNISSQVFCARTVHFIGDSIKIKSAKTFYHDKLKLS